MPRGHKYIKKYRNSHGNWTYVYDMPNGVPRMHETLKDDYENWARGRGHQYYRTVNGQVPTSESRISTQSTNSHDPYRKTVNVTRNTNRLLSRTGTYTSYESNPRYRIRVTGTIHETGKIERTYKRGKRKADKIVRSVKRVSRSAIEKGKKKLRNLLPHTEVTFHEAELKHR